MEIPFPRPLLYYDVQKLYSLEYSDGKSRISLDHAVEQLELNQERPFHRALDDAVYTGRTLRMIIWKHMGYTDPLIITGFLSGEAAIS